jgi:hypothetical protein
MVAGTALAMVATFLGPGQMQGFAQRVQQGSSWIGLDRMCLAIHPKRTGTVPGIFVDAASVGAASADAEDEARGYISGCRCRSNVR